MAKVLSIIVKPFSEWIDSASQCLFWSQCTRGRILVSTFCFHNHAKKNQSIETLFCWLRCLRLHSHSITHSLARIKTHDAHFMHCISKNSIFNVWSFQIDGPSIFFFLPKLLNVNSLYSSWFSCNSIAFRCSFFYLFRKQTWKFSGNCDDGGGGDGLFFASTSIRSDKLVIKERWRRTKTKPTQQ